MIGNQIKDFWTEHFTWMYMSFLSYRSLILYENYAPYVLSESIANKKVSEEKKYRVTLVQQMVAVQKVYYVLF